MILCRNMLFFLVISINAFPILHQKKKKFVYQHAQFQNILKLSVVNNRQKVIEST